MKAYLTGLTTAIAASAVMTFALPAMAGADAPSEEAPVYAQVVHKISIPEA